MRLLFSSIFILQFFVIKAQIVEDCGFEPSQTQIENINQAIEKFSIIPLVNQRSVTTIPIKIWLIDNEAGSQPIPDNFFDMMLAEANAAYFTTHLEYQFIDTITRIYSNAFADFNKTQESALKQSYYQDNVINFYVFNSLTHQNGTTLCGYAKFPGSSSDLIGMDKDCLLDGSTFVHELGHFWGLYHTHGTTSLYLTHELANGSNCAVAGDDVCDTPADPNLRDYVFEDCIYAENILDQSGQPFTPDPFNYMSYAHASCRSIFTEGQRLRMQYVHKYLRNHLTFSTETSEILTVDVSGSICDETKTVQYDYNGLDQNVIIKWDDHADGFIDHVGYSYTTEYNAPGGYDIKMEIEKDAEVVSYYLENAAQIFETKKLPFAYTFESENHDFFIANPDQDETWFLTQIDPDNNEYAISIDNYHNYIRGEVDEIILPPIMINGRTSGILTFDVAYAWHGVNYDDELKVQISTDCGVTYSTIYQKAGQDLATVEYQENNQWMPIDDSEWRTEEVDLADYLGQDVVIKFVNINDFGNQLYLNHINVDGDPPLAHKSLSFQGRKAKPKENLLQWKITDYSNINSVWIESSENGFSFEKISEIDLETELVGEYAHSYNTERDYYYRLAGIENFNTAVYSRVEFIPGESNGVLLLYPNPTMSYLMISLKSLPLVPAKYSGKIIDRDGRIVRNFSGQLVDKFEQIRIFTEDILNGVYFLSIEIENELYNGRFVKI